MWYLLPQEPLSTSKLSLTLQAVAASVFKLILIQQSLNCELSFKISFSIAWRSFLPNQYLYALSVSTNADTTAERSAVVESECRSTGNC